MTPYYVRGRKRNLAGRGGQSSAEEADRSAIAGGGRGKEAVANHDMKQDIQSGPRKRRRGQSSPEVEDGHMSIDEFNGNDGQIVSEKFPELGMAMLMLCKLT